MKSLSELVNHIPQVGEVRWIGLSPARKAPIEVVDQVEAQVGTGLEGDRHAQGGRSKRQVTLIQHEHLAVIASLLGRDAVDPAQVRRNVVVKGINLYALRNQRFRVGEVLLEGTGLCHPCQRMDENLGEGGFAAMRGHGGITAVVVEPGTLCIGDAVRRVQGLSPEADDS